MKHPVVLISLAAAMLAPSGALAWGGAGHRMIGELGVRALPAEAPAFLRSKQAALDVGELSREPDRSLGFGKLHDQDRAPGHYLDLDETGKLEGLVAFPPMPPTRQDFEKILAPAGLNSWKTGYLPYSVIDRWQQLTKDFGYWRVLAAAETNPKWRKNRKWFAADRRRREALILKDLGELSHFVADGSQPLHLTNHHNGWGDYPNPGGYSTAKLHAPFEGELVARTVREPDVAAAMTPLTLCDCSIEQQVTTYLMATNSQVIPFYEMEKAGGMAMGDPRGTAMATRQMAIGASMLRDLTIQAWRSSANITVGWKPIAVGDVVSGKIDPYLALYGTD